SVRSRLRMSAARRFPWTARRFKVTGRDASYNRSMRAIVTGGAGFLGSHLCTRLVEEGNEVVCIDNLLTGAARNVEHLLGESGFELVSYDVTNYLHVRGPVDFVFHFASPASPTDFERLPIQILKVGALGTHRALGLASANRAK